MKQRALIYARGGDGNLREICGQLLVEGLALRVELHSAAQMYLKKDQPKLTSVGRIMVLEVPAEHAETCLRRMKKHLEDFGDDSFSAVAVPVIAWS
ncbi:MAG: hypothetical protein KC731_29745 [Myxococcales bacterium]|nr:hypothetical protein [Myxococcales bacterium]